MDRTRVIELLESRGKAPIHADTYILDSDGVRREIDGVSIEEDGVMILLMGDEIEEDEDPDDDEGDDD